MKLSKKLAAFLEGRFFVVGFLCIYSTIYYMLMRGKEKQYFQGFAELSALPKLDKIGPNSDS